jgi:hypothetical protein
MKKNFLAFMAAIITFQLLSHVALALTASDAHGRPEYASGPRYELWRDHDHWHLRWTGAGERHHFTGRITAPEGDVYLDEKVDWEKKEDKIWKERREVRFDSWAKGGEDGFDFRWSGDELVLNLEIDGRIVKRKIFIGHDSIHPERSNFVIFRDRHWEKERREYQDRNPYGFPGPPIFKY